MNELTKEQSKILKGIAILFMVCLHLYNRSDTEGYYLSLLQIKGLPLVYYLSFICDACVPIYCFCAGYAAYLQKDNNMKYTLHRLMKLITKYWIILLLTCIFGYIFNDPNIPGNIFEFLGNVFLYDISYVGAWWFIQTYVLLTLSAPLLIKVVDHINKYILLFITLCIYLIAYYFRMMHVIHTHYYILNITINALVLYGTSLLLFIIGMLFRKYQTISYIRNKISNCSSVVGLFIILISIIIHIMIKSMIIAPFTAIIFIIGFILLDIKGFMKKVLLFFANHSTNIWLVHMQFYAIFLKDFVFSTNTVLGCFVILLGNR